MALSIQNLIESVCNPSGRFKTLRDIMVKTDDQDDPIFSFSGKTVSFAVWWKGKSYLLKCSLREDQEVTLLWRQVAAYLQNIRSPFLVGYYYLGKEMLVFNDCGDSGYIDVVLMEYPDNMLSMDAYIENACLDDDRERIEKLLAEFCRMAIWLINDDIVHGAVRASNIVVGTDGSVRLINYEYTRIPVAGSKEYESVKDSDNVMVANLALGLKAVAIDPAVFRFLKGNSMFRLPVTRPALLPVFSEAASKAKYHPMLRIIEMLSTCNHTLRNRLALTEALRALASDHTQPDIDFSEFIVQRQKSPAGEPDEDIQREELLLCQKKLKSMYDWVGCICESLICVGKGDLYGYVDCTGKEVIPFRYEWASDFMEGRAEIMHNGYYGLIDKSGKEILPATFELVEWNCDRGIAKVSSDGRFGLCDRDGKELVPFLYPWMGGIDNELILVHNDKKRYGYIRQDGNVAIPFCFDEAFDFINGRALVTRGNEKFQIDAQGRRMETVKDTK